jgi:hypothetical protein
VLYAILAAVVALGCLSAPAFSARRLARREKPSVPALLEQIRAAKSGEARADWLWELDELMIEIDGATRAPAELSLALGRASLASGTALAVLTLAGAPDLAHLPEAGAAFGAGVVGAMGAAYFGRVAKRHSAELRSHWSELARKVRRLLEDGPLAELPGP